MKLATSYFLLNRASLTVDSGCLVLMLDTQRRILGLWGCTFCDIMRGLMIVEGRPFTHKRTLRDLLSVRWQNCCSGLPIMKTTLSIPISNSTIT